MVPRANNGATTHTMEQLMQLARLAAPILALTVAVTACSDTTRPTSPSLGVSPSFAAQGITPSRTHQRQVRRGGHVFSLATVDNNEAAKPASAFYLFIDGKIQSITSVTYKRAGGSWVRNRARTTLFDANANPVHQVTLDADGRLAVSGRSPVSPFRLAVTSRRLASHFLSALGKLALPDALSAQGDPIQTVYDAQSTLSGAQTQFQQDQALCAAGGAGGCSAESGDEAAVSAATAQLQSALSNFGDMSGSSSSDFYDVINAFIASAGSVYCGGDTCVYLAE